MSVITVDGEAIPGDSPADDDREATARTARLELKLCKAPTALDPPHKLFTILHALITEQLRKLRRHEASD
jgi:hypothetical protein